MQKNDLVQVMAREAKISTAKAKEALATILINMSTALQKGEDVKLASFGTFSVAEHKNKLNPNLKAGSKTKSKKAVSFKPSKKLTASN